ncbi:MAG TPA: DUF1592 domain-containing protein [Polyangiaceae bacterium]|nr:DUF1592 domain-containing protein [Polyangiaceae bacterium]
MKLRLLTQAEYRASLELLFGDVTTPLELPEDTPVAGYISIGRASATVSTFAAEAYEAASRAVTAEVFADASRWPIVVGCQPLADLSDACVDTFVRSFGKRAFRRDLTDVEAQQWVKVARDAAALSTSAATGLSTATSGLLQSPNFLYRAEVNALDVASQRLKYDGPSMASRLSFFLTGKPPSPELLAAAALGQLDTVEGVRAAAAPMLQDPAALENVNVFFNEYSQAQAVLKAQKDPALFPTFNQALQNSMLEGTRLFIKNIVLAPGADVRSFFTSDQTFADALLAPIYGVLAPPSGFAQVTVPAETGRAGILGQAGVIAGHSKADHSSPTIRGLFILSSFLCITPDPPPGDVITLLPEDPNLTERQKLDLHRTSKTCAGCHALFDPLGFALEHFDSIGQYRATEHGLTIDATGSLNGVPFDGQAELGAVLSQSPEAMTCMMRNFYNSANARTDDEADLPVIEQLATTLASRNYVFSDFVAEFIASDAFRSAPAVPLTAGSL